MKSSPPHPGQILRDKLRPVFEREPDLTQDEIASTLGMSRVRFNGVLNGERRVTPDTAHRLARALGTTPEFWLIAQARHDAWQHTRSRSVQQSLDQVELLPGLEQAPPAEERPAPRRHVWGVQVLPQTVERSDRLRLLQEFLHRHGLADEAERYVRVRAELDQLDPPAQRGDAPAAIPRFHSPSALVHS